MSRRGLLGHVAVLFVSAGFLVALGPSESEAQVPRCFGQPATIVAVPGERTVGTPGPDVIVGTSGDDVIIGRGGDDLICSGAGNDRVDAGPGNDRVNGGPGNDRLTGGGGDDVLIGGGGDDVLSGGAGDDVLRGGAGNDVLRGGGGNDSLNGGPGTDRCLQGPGTGPVRNCELPELPEPEPPPVVAPTFPESCAAILTVQDAADAAGISPVLYTSFGAVSANLCAFTLGDSGDQPGIEPGSPPPRGDWTSGFFSAWEHRNVTDARQRLADLAASRAPLGGLNPIGGYGDEALLLDRPFRPAILFRCGVRVFELYDYLVFNAQLFPDDDYDTVYGTRTGAGVRELARLAEQRVCADSRR